MTDENQPDLLRAPADKRLGQHFLFDPDILKRVALAAGPVEGRDVIEIGPGPGGLTRPILQNGARKLLCLEMDDRFAGALRTWPDAATNRLQILQTDATTVALNDLISEFEIEPPLMIIANLPYNVGTPLLVGWLMQMEYISDMALMFQKEVAQRVCAQPGTQHYGRLAVLSHAVASSRMAFTLPPGAFKPPPKVASAVVSLKRLPPEKAYQNLSALQKVTGAAFGQRRKMLRASLKTIMPDGASAETLLEGIGIDPTRRAETLTQDEFRRLTDDWARLHSSSSKS